MSAARRTLPLPDLAASERLGVAIARVLRPGDVVALSGGLGAGKTTLARAILHALGHEGETPSPSFAIIEVYAELPVPVVHADFYRLTDRAEALELGLDDYRVGSAMIAEWPEHVGGFAHEDGCLAIAIEQDTAPGETGDGARIAIVEGGRDWLGRMPC